MKLYKNLKDSGGENIAILVDGGKIAEIFRGEFDESSLDLDETVDGGGLTVFPGLIDPHVHMRDPGLTHKEDLSSGGRAAAAGGICTFFDMPNTAPPCIMEEALLEKSALAREKSIVNFGFYFGTSRKNNSPEIIKAKDKAPNLKLFLNASTGDMLIEESEVLKTLFSVGERIFVHAEGEMVKKAIDISRETKKQLTICHISTAHELETALEEKHWREENDFPALFIEVAPHHLFLSEVDREKDEESRLLLLMKPQLAKGSDREALWQALVGGQIDMIGTDHAPHLLSEKLAKPCFGVPGIETSLALMLTAASRGQISLKDIERMMSASPAKVLGIKGKGKLEKGYDADFTIADINKEWTLEREMLQSKSGWSPFEGWQFKGKNELTVIAGEIVYNSGEFIEKTRGSEAKYG